jgi:hypothetical protein
LSTRQKKNDLVVRNASLLNVFSGKWHHAHYIIDVQARFVCTGLITEGVSFLGHENFCIISLIKGFPCNMCGGQYEIANLRDYSPYY